MNGLIARVCCLVLWISLRAADKILMTPFPFTSHVSQFYHIAEKLIETGHEVQMVVSPTLPTFAKLKNGAVSIIEHHTPNKDFYTIEKVNGTNNLEKIMDMTPIDSYKEYLERPAAQAPCINMLSDQKLFQKLKAIEFDLGIVDAIIFSRCFYILMYKLDIPYISISTPNEPWLLRNPQLPSFVPTNLGIPYTTKMTFWERFDNLKSVVYWAAFHSSVMRDSYFTKKYTPDLPVVSTDELASRSLLWLVDVDLVIDYPRPIMPNEIHIGGLTTKPANPLPKDLQEFVNRGQHGVIVMSFGSTAPNMANDKFIEAFRRIKQYVVWRFTGEPPKDLPVNVKVIEWMPQNDLLGHPNTKLFITHGGANGQYETMYHGVPVITFPLFSEQRYNAKRAEYHGLGLTLNVRQFDPADLVNTIKEITTNPSYSQKMKFKSNIFKDGLMSPSERAVYWIGHILKYGGDHLHSYALDMPWYQYTMLDIFLFLASIAIGLLFVICFVIKHIKKAISSAPIKVKKS